MIVALNDEGNAMQEKVNGSSIDWYIIKIRPAKRTDLFLST